jgi:chromosome segregation ATPase
MDTHVCVCEAPGPETESMYTDTKRRTPEAPPLSHTETERVTPPSMASKVVGVHENVFLCADKTYCMNLHGAVPREMHVQATREQQAAIEHWHLQFIHSEANLEALRAEVIEKTASLDTLHTEHVKCTLALQEQASEQKQVLDQQYERLQLEHTARETAVRRQLVAEQEMAVMKTGSTVQAACDQAKNEEKAALTLRFTREQAEVQAAHTHACAERDAAVEALNDHVFTLSRELDAARTEAAAEAARAATATEDHALWITRLEQGETSLAKAFADIYTLREQVTELESTKEGLETEVKSLQKSLSAAQLVCEEHEKQLGTQTTPQSQCRVCDVLRLQFQHAVDQRNECASELETALGRHQRVLEDSVELLDAKSRLEAALTQQQELQRQFADSKVRSDAATREIQTEFATLGTKHEQSMRELKLQTACANLYKARLREILATFFGSVDAAETYVAMDAESVLAWVRERLSQLTAHCEEQGRALERSHAQCDVLGNEVSELRRVACDAQEQASTATIERDAVRVLCESTSAKLEETTHALVVLQREKNAADGTANALHASIADYEDQIGVLSKHARSMKAERGEALTSITKVYTQVRANHLLGTSASKTDGHAQRLETLCEGLLAKQHMSYTSLAELTKCVLVYVLRLCQLNATHQRARVGFMRQHMVQAILPAFQREQAECHAKVAEKLRCADTMMTEKLRAADAVCVDLHTANATLEGQMRQCKALIESLSAQNGSLRDTVGDVQTELATTQASLARKTLSLREMKASLASTQEHSSRAVDKLTKRLAQQTMRVEHLVGQCLPDASAHAIAPLLWGKENSNT